MTQRFPDLSRYDLLAFDTETTGLDTKARPVGCSIALPDGQSFYWSWGAGDPAGVGGTPDALGFENNCSLAEFRTWANAELTRPGVVRVAHNAPFDLRMLAYHGISVTGVEDTQACAALLDEHRPGFSLNALSAEFGLTQKDDHEINQWCASQPWSKGPATRKAQGKNYWRVTGKLMAPYARHDAEMTLALFNKIRPMITPAGLSQVYALERDLMPVLLRMHLAGVRVDYPRAVAMKAGLMAELDALKRSWDTKYPGVNYHSGMQLGPILTSLGIVFPMTAGGKKPDAHGNVRPPIPSITKEWLETLDHPLGEHVRKMRQIGHYAGTFIQSYLLDAVTADNDILHPEFHAMRGDSYGTVSGRLSSGGELNAQNIPARDEVWGPKIRSLFRPMRDDQLWMKIDYSQIEYRFFAHYAGERARLRNETSAMEEAYLADPHIDFHQWVADTAHIKRKRAKNVNFCRLYGGGIAKIAATAGCSIEEATEFVNAYDAEIPEAQALAKDISDAGSRRGYVRTWGGRILRFMTEAAWHAKYKKELPAKKNPHRYAMTHAALNRVLQGSSADLTKLAMIEVDKVIDWEQTIMHLTVHDELDFSVARDGAVETRDQLVSLMQDVARTPSWNGHVMRVPVLAEAELGSNWGMLDA